MAASVDNELTDQNSTKPFNSCSTLNETVSEGYLSAIRAIFWDVGGVLLTNAWDHTQRMQALDHFQIDQKEFHDRHEMVVSSFERGKISLDEYLSRTVFFRKRSVTREEFREYILSLSEPLPGMIEFAQSLSNTGKYLMGTINNESRELNYFRMEKFGLRNIFRLFFSSCFVGLRKPEEGIYRLVLETTQITAAECCFIDDRSINVEAAAQMGMRAVEMHTLDQLREELRNLGVSA